MTLKRKLFGVAFVSSLAIATVVSTVVGEDAADAGTAVATTPGISSEKPAEGPFVEVDGQFLVPYTERIPGTDVTFEMVPVPGGSFLLGSPEEEAGRREDEGPQIRVRVEPMWVAKEEVSWAEYTEFMNLYGVFKEFEARNIRPVNDENRYDAITAPTELYEPSHTYEYGQEDDQPAVTMTQYAAKQYSKWLSRVTGTQYRLPTEAEWEYACRGGTETAFSWGDDASEIEDYAWYIDNAFDGQVPGGQKEANPFGLYDMHGDVAEWVVDRYTEDGYASLPTDRELTVQEAVQWPERAYPAVLRGGSWEMESEDLRSAARLGSDDKDWKEADPNYPRSPWWFTSDPARGIGFRLFRSYKPLADDLIVKYWDMSSEDIRLDVKSRISGGRAALGLVDKELPAAIQSMKD